jgi:hypothetical protein
MKEFFKKITGLKKLEEERIAYKTAIEDSVLKLADHQKETEKAKEETEKAKEEERLSKLAPKERATELKEPYVAVLDTKVNPDNVRNGFFELDWNEYFIVQLREAGYGFDADPEEEIVDRWFRDLARNILSEEGQDVTRGAGYINVIPIEKGRSEIS